MSHHQDPVCQCLPVCPVRYWFCLSPSDWRSAPLQWAGSVAGAARHQRLYRCQMLGWHYLQWKSICVWSCTFMPFIYNYMKLWYKWENTVWNDPTDLPLNLAFSGVQHSCLGNECNDMDQNILLMANWNPVIINTCVWKENDLSYKAGSLFNYYDSQSW